MKRCSKCKKMKQDCEFYKDKRQESGLRPSCKECDYEYTFKHRGYKKHREVVVDPLGGYKITILNYAKKGEYQYNILSTKGELYQYNSDDDFLTKIKEIVKKESY